MLVFPRPYIIAMTVYVIKENEEIPLLEIPGGNIHHGIVLSLNVLTYE